MASGNTEAGSRGEATTPGPAVRCWVLSPVGEGSGEVTCICQGL